MFSRLGFSIDLKKTTVYIATKSMTHYLSQFYFLTILKKVDKTSIQEDSIICFHVLLISAFYRKP